jgi:acetyl/propionyl-CoA carboxylase alpha subunit/acetyl-CoA carboxylase carboxyltransferase component
MSTVMTTTLQRLGVLDRGETAVRVLHAVGVLNSTDETAPITTVLFHDERERQPWFGREADEAVGLAVGSTTPVDDLMAALQRAHVDTVWLGRWPTTDRAALVDACESAGIGVVGPDAATIRALADPNRLDAAAHSAGFDHELSEPARYRVMVDVIVDHHGTIWTTGCRGVNVHLGDQILLAEASCASVDDALAARIRAAVEALALDLGVCGAVAVTVTHDGTHFVLEAVDPVAAPDHATAEERTGVSFVGLRLRLQRGESLDGPPPSEEGVAVEARILADPILAAADASRIALLSFPVGTGVRIDANRRVGDVVEPDDPLVAVITAWGPDRPIAMARLRRALERTSVVLEGCATNRTLLLALLGHRELRAGNVDERWLPGVLDGDLTPPPDPIALVAAAVEAYESDRLLAQQRFYLAAATGRPEQPEDVGGKIELSYRGNQYEVRVDHTGPRSYSVRRGSQVADVHVDRFDDFERRMTGGGRRHRILVSPLGSAFHIEVDGVAHLVGREDGIVVRAGWPALVVAALVEPGQHVAAGSPIAVLESMKMETTVTAPFDGEVLAVAIAPNAQVDRGTPIVRIRPSTLVDHRAAPDGGTVDLSGLQHRTDFTRKPCDRVYGPLGQYLLGFDLSPQAMRRLLTEQRRLAEIAEPADPALVACEDSLLDIYADLGALYRPVTESDPEAPGPDMENTQEYFVAFMQWIDADRAGLPENYRVRLRAALERYGIHDLEHTAELEPTLMRLFRSFYRLGELSPMVSAILQRRLEHRVALASVIGAQGRTRLDRLAAATQGRQQHLAELARDVRFHYFDEPPMEEAAAELRAEMADHLRRLASDGDASDRAERVARLVWCPHPLRPLLLSTWRSAETFEDPAAVRRAVLEVHIGRFYRARRFGAIDQATLGEFDVAWTDYDVDGSRVHLVVGYIALADLPAWSEALAAHVATIPPDDEFVIDVVGWREGERPDIDAAAEELGALLDRCRFGRRVRRIDVDITSSVAPGEDRFWSQNLTFRQGADGDFVEDELYRNLHPMLAKRLELWRLSNFRLERRPSPEDVYLFHGVAHTNPRDQRLFAVAEIRDLNAVTDPATGMVSYPRLERVGLLAVAAMRSELARYAAPDRPVANRIVLDIREPWTIPADHVSALAHRFAPLAGQVGLEKVVLKVRIPDEHAPGGLRDAVLQFEGVGHSVLVHEERAGNEPVRPLSSYQQKVLTSARFGSPYPYEIVRLLTAGGDLPVGTFVELDLDDVDTARGDVDQLVPVDREPGNNSAHIVVGLLTNHTEVVPEGMQRVVLLSDPTQGLGNLAEPECRRVNAALAYAQAHQLPVEWFAVSSGALISMESGTENMDWIALTLRRLIEYTQAGGEVNIVVTGINVGGQPYWNAEATMLMHTKGILVMTPSSTMVLTGKQALDFSGAVSAEDNLGIGGFDRVMGPNGQAQYWAPSFPAACALLIRHYELTYVVPGEHFPRRRPTRDPVDRDVRDSVHADIDGSPFETVGDVFSAELNPERKQPFDMRSVMGAVADQDCEPLERWQSLRDGDTSIVWDATIGGIPVCLLGLESHPVARKGFVPADGPPVWTSGTLFPHSSRKTARAVNAASGSRPLVVLANLSGFDGSPESMRRRQLEYGAEIGRAVTNFVGPIVFVVVSRYHGGAFVVFSKALNESMEIAAVEGSYASVIGGAPAAATVFAREVKQRTERDERVRDAREALDAAAGATATDLRLALADISARVRSEKLTEVADEFDSIHTIERALRVGSVDRIIAASDLRPYVVDALERGMART